MNSWTVPVALVACAVFAPVAHADQCRWVDHAVAARAAALISRRPLVVSYCQPCGDAAPGVPLRVGDVSVRPVRSGREEVVVDGRPIDLAYTYVDAGVHSAGTSVDRYGNLAELAGCPVTGVSPSMRVDRATSNGVLITADDVPARPPVPVASPPRAAPVRSPAPAPRRVTYEVSVAPASPGWIFGLACYGGALTAGLILGLIGLAGMRRRRATLPRALELSDRLAGRRASQDPGRRC